MRSRKELLAKRRELRKEWAKLITETENSKDTKSSIRPQQALANFLRGPGLAAEISLLDWILNKPTARQLKAEALFKFLDKKNKKKK